MAGGGSSSRKRPNVWTVLALPVASVTLSLATLHRCADAFVHAPSAFPSGAGVATGAAGAKADALRQQQRMGPAAAAAAAVLAGRRGRMGASGSALAAAGVLEDSLNSVTYKLRHVAGKLTLVPELTVGTPTDFMALAEFNADVTGLSKTLRETAKANALLLSCNLKVLGEVCKEQESARGGMPDPVPVLYAGPAEGVPEGESGVKGLDLAAVAQTGAVGVCVEDEAGAAAAREAGLVPLLTVDIGESDTEAVIEAAAGVVGDGGIVRAKGKAIEVSADLAKRVIVLADVSVPAGDGRVGERHAELGAGGLRYAGAVLGELCCPPGVLEKGPGLLAAFWSAICQDLKSTRSKSIVMNYRASEQTDEWGKYFQKLDDEGAIDNMMETTDKISGRINPDQGDWAGF